MSAIGPQFYEFMKKLDENNGRLPTSITSRPFQPEFEFNNSTCYICNGYYGPGFGEPVCMTCHEFLYPDIPHQMPDSYVYSEKTDDGDSGNDEPSVGELMYNDRRFTRVVQQQGVYHWTFRFHNAERTSPVPGNYSERKHGNTSSGPNGSTSGDPNGGPSGGPISGPNGVPTSGPNGGPNGTPNYGTHGGPNSGHSGEPSGDTNSGPTGVRNCGSNSGLCGAPIDVPKQNHRGGLFSDPYGGPGPSHDDGTVPGVPDDNQSRPVLSNLVRSLVALSTPRLPDNLAPGMVEQLPSEVLLCMFSYLDDLSLCACALVCARWFRLVQAHVTQSRWETSVTRRWPLLQPRIYINDWHKKYQALLESCFCRNCVVQMCVQTQPPFEENAWRRNRLRNEIKMLRSPPEGCAALPLDPKCCHWQATVTGPVGSPYEGGIFFLYIQVPYTYPMTPPVVRFLTRILHPNVSRHGDVGIDSVHNNWSLAITIGKLLISIQSLLTDPYTAVCMEPAVGDMYVNDRARFDRIARRWTWQYAMHDMYS